MSRKSYIYCLTLLVMILSCSISCSGKKSKDMKASEIIKLIQKGKDVSLNDKVIFDDVDFTDIEKYRVVAFPNMESRIPVNITFTNCVFMGKVLASTKKSIDGSKKKINVFTTFEKNLTFFSCDFRGDVAMDDMVVDGKLEFANSVFRENASFNSLYVKGSHIGFLSMESEKDFSMCYARFLCDANFMGAKFKGRANFLGMNVMKVQFSNAEFGNEVDFSNSIFMGDALFNYINCASSIQFSFSKYYGDFDLIKSSCNGAVSFERSFFFGRVCLNKTEFNGSIELKDEHSLFTPETQETKFSSDNLQWNVVKNSNVILNSGKSLETSDK
ncbi:MAG: hypothetical protein MJZ33_13970 [Paludibacteraceae bacterium]|nr:hypothetical protein [Paludibacteraceae bacterium]